MEHYFVLRIDEHSESKNKTNKKKPPPQEHQCEIYDSYGDDYEEYNPFHQRGVRMPAIIASEGTSKAIKLSQPKNNFYRKPSFSDHMFKTKPILKRMTNEIEDKDSNIRIKIKSCQSNKSSSNTSVSSDSKSSSKRSSENTIKDIRSTQSKRKLESAASDEKIERILKQVEDHARQWIGEGLIKQENSNLKPMPSFVSDISSVSPDKANSFSKNIVLPDIKQSKEPLDKKTSKTKVAREKNKKSNTFKKEKDLQRIEKEKIEPLISKLFLCKDDEILKGSLDSTECLIGKPKTKFEKIPEKKKKSKVPLRKRKKSTDKTESTQDIFLNKNEVDSLKVLHQPNTTVETNDNNLSISNSKRKSSFAFSIDKGLLSGTLLGKSEEVMVKKQNSILDHTMLDPTDIKGWKMLVEEKLQDEIDCSIRGNRVKKSGRNQYRALMDFVPTKMLLKPEVVKESLFPAYHGTVNLLNKYNPSDEQCSNGEEVDTDEEVLEEKWKKSIFDMKTLLRKHRSTERLSKEEDDIIDEKLYVEDEVKLNKYASLPNIHIFAVNKDARSSLANTDYSTGMKEVEIQKEAFADAQAQEHDKIVKKALQMGMTIKEYEQWLLLKQYQAVKTEMKTLEEREKEAASLNLSLEEYMKRIKSSASKTKRGHKKASLKSKRLLGNKHQNDHQSEDDTDVQKKVDKRAISKNGSKYSCQNRQSETLPFEEYQAWILKNAKKNNMTLEVYTAYLQEQADKLKLSLEEYIARLMRTEFSKVSSLATSDNWDYFDPAVIRRHIEGVRYSAPMELKKGSRPILDSKEQRKSSVDDDGKKSVDDGKDTDTDDDGLADVIAKEVRSNFDLQQSHIAKSYISVSSDANSDEKIIYTNVKVDENKSKTIKLSPRTSKVSSMKPESNILSKPKLSITKKIFPSRTSPTNRKTSPTTKKRKYVR